RVGNILGNITFGYPAGNQTPDPGTRELEKARLTSALAGFVIYFGYGIMAKFWGFAYTNKTSRGGNDQD
ncbi:unnamed protein product, partial [Timema podura]|nr:unnamed protein product [Timema podura]